MNLNNYADVLISALKNARSGKFKKGDNILVSYDAPALEISEILYTKLFLFNLLFSFWSLTNTG